MAPAASTLSATSAAASSKRPAESDAELLLQDSSTLPQGGDNSHHHPAPKQQPLECPRCHSTNTKFCYYNNYSMAQPRHFCRACRRYWTHGGTLRDVPVGGASRRDKRRRMSASASPPPDQATTTVQLPAEDACLSDLSSAATTFPFLSDGSFFLPHQHLDLAAVAPPPAFNSWSTSSVVPDFFDGLAPWDDGAGGAAGVPGARGGDMASLDLSWQPPAY